TLAPGRRRVRWSVGLPDRYFGTMWVPRRTASRVRAAACEQSTAMSAAELPRPATRTRRPARTEVGANVMPFLAPLLDQAGDWPVGALGATGSPAEFEAGKSLDREAASAFALGEPAQAPLATPGHAGPGPLAQREAEVAQLVADGLTNKQIGTR